MLKWLHLGPSHITILSNLELLSSGKCGSCKPKQWMEEKILLNFCQKKIVFVGDVKVYISGCWDPLLTLSAHVREPR